jgi:3-deoxy-manno-octulosonate cytidylyltransferase (CMP-KDO synthetase)
MAGTSSGLVVIPARFASTRYPGKPLAILRGANGTARSLLERTWRNAHAAELGLRIVIATDDTRVRDLAYSFGAEVVMTSPACRNGTERCAEVAGQMAEAPPFILNLQGDALLTPPSALRGLIRAMDDPGTSVATPVMACTPETRTHLLADRQAGRVGGTTAVFDRTGRALYFSKEVLPFGADTRDDTPTYLHLGVYAYRAEALSAYAAAEPQLCETSEGLEQLRFLELGWPVHVVEITPPEGLLIELNNPEDVPLIEAELRRRGID